MNALDHLERVLSITEQFKPQLTGIGLDWWSEASAFAADERQLSDSCRAYVVTDEQDGETVYWSNSFDPVDVGGEDGSGGGWVGDIESASKFSQEEIQSYNLPIGVQPRWQDVTTWHESHGTALPPGTYSCIVLNEDGTWIQPTFRIDTAMTEQEFCIQVLAHYGGDYFLALSVDTDEQCPSDQVQRLCPP